MSNHIESAARFFARFKDEVALLEFFWNQIGQACSTCKSTKLTYASNRRSRYCENFHREHATGDTFFENSKSIMTLALALWFAAENVWVSGAELARLTGASGSTAWFNLKKVAFMALDLMNVAAKAPSERFVQIIGRRSLETPRNQHPLAEIRTIRIAETESSVTPSGHRRNSEEQQDHSQRETFVIELTIREVKSVHQQISRKYLQLFAAATVFLSKAHNFEELLARCFTNPPVTIGAVLSYVSPAIIQIPAD